MDSFFYSSTKCDMALTTLTKRLSIDNQGNESKYVSVYDANVLMCCNGLTFSDQQSYYLHFKRECTYVRTCLIELY